MGLPIYHSQYTAAQIEASIGKGPRVNASGYWEVWNISTMAYESTGVGAGVTPPTVVTQVSQMTNHGYVYIYNGSEAGYTAGYWYYWNGSAWTAGGAYQVAATDPTLSVAGAAADAKATGDNLGELKNTLDATDESISNEFEILIGNKAGVFKSGYYTTPISVGGAVTLGKDARYVTSLIPVVPGDKVTLNATGGTGTQRLYVWIDSTWKSLNLASTNLSGVRTITAPENAVYLAINNKLTSQPTGYYAYKGSKPTFVKWDSTSVIPEVDAFYFDWSIGYTISSTGVYGTNSKYATTEMIPVKEGNVIYNTTTGYGKDNCVTAIMLALYSNNVFVVRKGLATGSKYIIEEGYDGMRIIYGYTSDSPNPPAMTKYLLSEYFSVRFMKAATPMDYTGDGERPYYVALGASTTAGAVHHYSGESITYSKNNYPTYIGKVIGLKSFNLGVGSTGLIERGDYGYPSYGTKKNIMDQIYTNDSLLGKAGLVTLMFAYGNDRMVGEPQTEFPIGTYTDYYPYDEEGYHPSGAEGIVTMINKGATLFGCLNWCIKYLNEKYPKAQLVVIFGSPSANTSPRTVTMTSQTPNVGTPPYVLTFGDFGENSDIRTIHDGLKILRTKLNVPIIDLYFEGNAFTAYSTYAKDPDDGSYVLFSTVGTSESPVFNTHPNDEGYKRFARYLAGKVISLFDH